MITVHVDLEIFSQIYYYSKKILLLLFSFRKILLKNIFKTMQQKFIYIEIYLNPTYYYFLKQK